jgi:AAA family ATP:ADP antiporter
MSDAPRDSPPENRAGADAGYASMSRWSRCLSRVVDVRPSERTGLLWSFLYFFFLLAGYYVLRPLRDEMAIAGGVSRLQWLFTATLGLMLVAVPIWSSLAARLRTHTLIAFVYRFFLVNILIFFALFHLPSIQVGVARAFFVWSSVFNLFVVSIFWSLMADVFRQDQGKRLFGFVAAGGSAGAIFGPVLTSTLVGAVGPVNLLLIVALLLEAASQCAARLSAWAAQRSVLPDQSTLPSDAPAPAREVGTGVGGGAWGALRSLAASPYLLAIAGYVLFLTITGTLAYVLQARLIAAAGLSPIARTALFARIDLAVNIGAALAQAFLAGRALTRFGVGPALLLSPLLTIGCALALGVAPRLGVLVGGNVIRRVSEYAVSHPARQVLFTIVPREDKYKTKALIDTVVYRSGDVVGSWAFAAVARQGASIPVLAASAIPVAVIWLALAAWLARQHNRRGDSVPAPGP